MLYLDYCFRMTKTFNCADVLALQKNNLMDFMLVLSEDYFIDSYIVLRFSIKKSLQIPSEALLS